MTYYTTNITILKVKNIWEWFLFWLSLTCYNFLYLNVYIFAFMSVSKFLLIMPIYDFMIVLSTSWKLNNKVPHIGIGGYLCLHKCIRTRYKSEKRWNCFISNRNAYSRTYNICEDESGIILWQQQSYWESESLWTKLWR